MATLILNGSDLRDVKVLEPFLYSERMSLIITIPCDNNQHHLFTSTNSEQADSASAKAPTSDHDVPT